MCNSLKAIVKNWIPFYTYLPDTRMPSILDLCEKYYSTRDIYELLGIPKDALVKDGKREMHAKCIRHDAHTSKFVNQNNNHFCAVQ